MCRNIVTLMHNAYEVQVLYSSYDYSKLEMIKMIQTKSDYRNNT